LDGLLPKTFLEKENLGKDSYGQGKLSKNSDYFCHH
jgi:hypothetical protein